MRRCLISARYTSAHSPPKVRQVISTLESATMSRTSGGEGSASDAQSAHRQRVFHCFRPVYRLSLMSCSLPDSETRTVCISSDIPHLQRPPVAGRGDGLVLRFRVLQQVSV